MVDGPISAVVEDVQMNNGTQPARVAESASESSASEPERPVLEPLSELPPTHEDTDEDDEEEEGDSKDRADGVDSPIRFTKSGRKRATPFPVKLMSVLSNKEYVDIVSWMPSGRCFLIHNSKVFTREILPKHFKSAKYSSFTRKLHRWGFTRHYKGDEEGAFYAKNFQKGRLDLVEKMTCYRAETAGMVAAKEKKKVTRAEKGATQKKQQAAASSFGQPATRPGQFGGLAGMMMQSSPGSNGSRPDLNAAIEMEVSRRLQERMAGANGGAPVMAGSMAPQAVVAAPPGTTAAMMPPPGYMLAPAQPTFVQDPRYMWQNQPQFVPVGYVRQPGFPQYVPVNGGNGMAPQGYQLMSMSGGAMMDASFHPAMQGAK